ncbi:MAG: hypothetical protein KJ072_22160 [Verrucomicrobia bacterium]|nr:hypothetical protein [Verrucomicrobiota bacterium]
MTTNPNPTAANVAADRMVLIARISLICPFLVVLLALIAGRIEPPSRTIAELAGGLLAVIGLLCGIAALTRGRRSAGTTVAVQGGIGFLISLVFVGIVLNDYLRARQQAQSDPGPGTPRTEGVFPAAQRLAEALARFVARTTELDQRLAAAAKPLGESPVLKVAEVKSTADLDARRKLVEAFLEASQALNQHLAQAQPFIESQLSNGGMPAAEASEIAAQFLKNLEPQISTSLQIREIENLYSQTLIETLDLLSRQRDGWVASPEGDPRFADDALARQYSGLLQRLNELETRDLELKRKLSNPG